MKLPAWSKKLPKKVTILGRVYKIVYNMEQGACGDCDKLEIIIGCCRPRVVALEYLVHEISEIIHVEAGYRFDCCREHRFVMDHAEFQNHTMILVAALIDCGLMK